MTELEEIRELLREIRDLQKAHFERYKEFTQEIRDGQRTVREDAERAQSEARRIREKMHRDISTAWALRLTWLGLAVAVAALAMGVTFLPWFLGPPRP